MNKNIVFIICIIIVSGILFGMNFIFSHEGNTVYIYSDSEIYKTVPLDENAEINVNDTNTVVVENGRVYMSSSTCPDKLCIHQGEISDSSRNIICLPNKIVVKVDKASSVDAVSQ